MRVGTDLNRPRQNISIKRSLIKLNRDLEIIISDIDDKSLDQVIHEHSHTITLTSLSNLQMAILYLEDRRFFCHRGFEFRAPLRILKRLISGKRAGAISTIDQQLVRISTNRYERTLRRKVREVILAFFVNFHRSKAQILYTYIHDSYFGYKLEGCEITSRFLFSKPAKYLSENEACFIAALLARPLPKKVANLVEKEKVHKDITPEYIIYLGDLEGLNWSRHVKLRYLYVQRMFPSIPKSLLTR